MDLMSDVWKLSRQAGIPDEIMARKILGISRASLHRWDAEGVPADRIYQLEVLRDTLQHYINNGKLPVNKEELIWQGIIHLTECLNITQE